MSEDKTFVCPDCGRTLPAWMQTPEGQCDGCAEDSLDPDETNTEIDDGAAVQDDSQDQVNSTEKNQPADGGRYPQAVEEFWDDNKDLSEIQAAEKPAASPESTESSSSEDGLDRKIDSWKDQLLNLTRRSNLVDFSATKTKTLPLHRSSPQNIASSINDGDEIYIRKSSTEEEGGAPPDAAELESDEVASTRSQEATENSLYNIGLNQRRYQRERGIDATFFALGTLRWYDVAHSDNQLRTPIFLIRSSLEEGTNRQGERHDYKITASDQELLINPALRKQLLDERGITLAPDQAFSLDHLDRAFAYIDDTISGFDRWHIVPESILGIFDFAKFGLYQDLETNREAVRKNPLVRAMNGDQSAVRDQPSSPTAEELDEAVFPVDTHQVLDADSSQMEAIEAAKNGMDFVLQGPPGTGKSQTIANIIAEKMGAGETILFVSEKQAALEVVQNRLADVGLGRFCLEAHGKKADKERILDELGREMDADPLAPPDEREKVLDSLSEVKNKLNAYKDRLFFQPDGQTTTAYEAFGIVSKFSHLDTLDTGIGDPLSLTDDVIDEIESELERLQAFDAQLQRDGSHPWQHARLDGWVLGTEDRVEDALEGSGQAIQQVRDVSHEVTTNAQSLQSVSEVQDLVAALDEITDFPTLTPQETHLSPDFYAAEDSLSSLAELSQSLAGLRADIAGNYEPSIYDEDPQEFLDQLEEYGFSRYVSPSYRSLKSQILEHAVDEYEPDLSDLKSDMRALIEIEQLESDREEFDQLIELIGPGFTPGETDWEAVFALRDWTEQVVESGMLDASTIISTGESVVNQELDVLQPALNDWEDARSELDDIIDLDAVRITDKQIEEAPFDEVADWIEARTGRTGALRDWLEYKSARTDALETPAREFLQRFIDANREPDTLVDTFRVSFYTEWLREVYRETGLENFSATEFASRLKKFRHLDQQQWEYDKAEIQHRVTNRRPQFELEYASSSEQVYLKREIQKSQRHDPLRELFANAPSLITDLKPCFMMSPLSVAQNIELETIEFDVVIFDEASQVMPQDAVSSLIRSDQVIIAGDSQQLPPTSFFDADIDAAKGVREDLESILDEAATVLPKKRLLWHYRSRTDELIEFSNQKYYDGRLQTFPDNVTDEDLGVEFEYVENGVYDRGGSSTNEPEAERILELIKTHIEETPDKSLGVVAFSSSQAQQIRDVLERERQTNEELDAFMSEDDALEEFFVKSLENVQGDERDVLMFSVGYGPDQTGKISMNFGPLNHTGGERRLNVAVTRARERVRVVSSLQPGQIDLSRTEATGVRDFKHYLEYAKNGQRALVRSDSAPQTLEFDSSFEEAVYSALEDRGFDVVTQIESSGYSIDLGIKHPSKPGKFILGIECDGAAYHSSKTARDRDRTRQAVLEDLGWTIHRIWSPDWAADPERQLDEIEQSVENLLSETATTDGGVRSIETEPIEVDALPKSERNGLEQHLSDWTDPTLRTRSDKSVTDLRTSSITQALTNVVESHGPIAREAAFRATIHRWGSTRLGKNIRKKLNGALGLSVRRGNIHSEDGFLWPGTPPEKIPIRTNTSRESRSIDEIAVVELARASHLILEAGNKMTREDLVLEVARLYGFSRTGSKIKSRINSAVDLLIQVGTASKGADGMIAYEDMDIDNCLLVTVYE